MPPISLIANYLLGMALFFPSGGKKKSADMKHRFEIRATEREHNISIACRLSTQTGRDWLWTKVGVTGYEPALPLEKQDFFFKSGSF